MRIQSVRFSELQWAEVQQEAHREGVSASQYVREATLARVWFSKARRGGTEAQEVDELLRAARAHDNGSDG